MATKMAEEAVAQLLRAHINRSNISERTLLIVVHNVLAYNIPSEVPGRPKKYMQRLLNIRQLYLSQLQSQYKSLRSHPHRALRQSQ
jgi:hypothetical protein